MIDPRLLSLLPHLRRVLGGLLAPGQQTDVFATLVDGALDVVIDLPQPPALDGREALAAFAVEADVARLSWRLSSHSDSEPVATRRSVAATLAGVAVLPPPGAFRQASAEGEAALVTAVLDAVGDATPVADLFCGIGTFTVPLMRRGLAVTAVDRDGALVDSLAAACRPWPRVSCRRRDLFKQALTAAELAGFAAVVIDPPRAGAAVQMAELARSSVPVVVAVSCNPETFARDARLLVDGGYRLVHVTPVDQFLWSPHLELAAVFRR